LGLRALTKREALRGSLASVNHELLDVAFISRDHSLEHVRPEKWNGCAHKNEIGKQRKSPSTENAVSALYQEKDVGQAACFAIPTFQGNGPE
jgi:hypothetical protein